MHTISIPFSSLTASPTNVIISRSTNVMGHPKFVKLPRIGRNSGNLAINSHPNPAVAVEPSGGEDNVVGEKDGVVVVDHGSRRQESNLLLNEFVAMFRARTGYRIVEPAHMELAEPTIMDAFGQCVQQGACRIIVSPYFLSPGRHWQKDIPALAAEASKEHSNIPYIVTAPLGLHELMVGVCTIHAPLAVKRGINLVLVSMRIWSFVILAVYIMLASASLVHMQLSNFTVDANYCFLLAWVCYPHKCPQSAIPYFILSPFPLMMNMDVMNDRIKHCLSQVAGNADECSVCARTGKCRLYP